MTPHAARPTVGQRQEAEHDHARANAHAPGGDFLHAQHEADPRAHRDQVPLNEQIAPPNRRGLRPNVTVKTGQPHRGMVSWLFAFVPMMASALVFPSGSSEGAFVAPFVVKAHVQGALADSNMATPLGHGSRNTIERHLSICSRVVQLLNHRRPPAISRLVVPIGVDTVKRVRRGRARPHVFIERLEAMEPSTAHGDAPSPVVPKALVFGVEASLLHLPPRGELFCLGHPVRYLRPGAENKEFLAQASTAFGVAALEAFGGDSCAFSAVASALAVSPCLGDDGQPTVLRSYGDVTC